MNEQDVINIFGKSIWEMSVDELYKYHLDELWVKLVDDASEE